MTILRHLDSSWTILWQFFDNSFTIPWQFFDNLYQFCWWRANARNVGFRISLPWPIHIISPVDKIKLSCKKTHSTEKYKKQQVTAMLTCSEYNFVNQPQTGLSCGNFGKLKIHFLITVISVVRFEIAFIQERKYNYFNRLVSLGRKTGRVM